jgi:hypothetical protein
MVGATQQGLREKRRLRIMKRIIVVLTVATLMLGVLAVGAGYAKDEDAAEAKCSEATLDGRYLLAFDGVEINGKDQVPFAVAGYEVFNGNGHAKGVSSFSVNGKITSMEPFSATYTVRADCTGTTTVEGLVVTHYDLFTAPDGSMITFVQTDPGVVAAGFELRATAKRVGD